LPNILFNYITTIVNLLLYPLGQAISQYFKGFYNIFNYTHTCLTLQHLYYEFYQTTILKYGTEYR